jgi:hypothetical protein
MMWYPMKIGNWWEYGEKEDGGSPVPLDTLTFTILSSQEAFDGNTGYECLVEEGYTVESTNWFVPVEDEIRLYYTDHPPHADTLDHYTLLKLPVEVGNRWPVVGIEQDTIWAEVISTTDRVAVPAGGFTDCVCVEFDGEVTTRFWFSSEVGLVRFDNVAFEFTMELLRYNLK